MEVYSFARAAVLKYRGLGGFTNNFIDPQFWSCARPLEAGCWQSGSLACGHFPRICALNVASPVSVFMWPFFKDTSHIELGPT